MNGKTIHGDGDSGRLLALSNGAPIRIINEHGQRRIEPTVGGVGATFLRLLERHGGVWIAWSGSKTAPAPLQMPPDEPRFWMVFPPLSEPDISFYYHGMCNRGLWPLMHLMPKNCHFRAQHWNCYKAVNELFAKVTDARASDHDRVWIRTFIWRWLRLRCASAGRCSRSAYSGTSRFFPNRSFASFHGGGNCLRGCWAAT